MWLLTQDFFSAYFKHYYYLFNWNDALKLKILTYVALSEEVSNNFNKNGIKVFVCLIFLWGCLPQKVRSSDSLFSLDRRRRSRLRRSWSTTTATMTTTRKISERRRDARTACRTTESRSAKMFWNLRRFYFNINFLFLGSMLSLSMKRKLISLVFQSCIDIPHIEEIKSCKLFVGV